MKKTPGEYLSHMIACCLPPVVSETAPHFAVMLEQLCTPKAPLANAPKLKELKRKIT